MMKKGNSAEKITTFDYKDESGNTMNRCYRVSGTAKPDTIYGSINYK